MWFKEGMDFKQARDIPLYVVIQSTYFSRSPPILSSDHNNENNYDSQLFIVSPRLDNNSLSSDQHWARFVYNTHAMNSMPTADTCNWFALMWNTYKASRTRRSIIGEERFYNFLSPLVMKKYYYYYAVENNTILVSIVLNLFNHLQQTA